MDFFVNALLGASLAGGVFILAAILVRAGVRHRLPKHFLVLLWAAVLVRLLFLSGVPSPTSIHNYVAFRDRAGAERVVYPASFGAPGAGAGGGGSAGEPSAIAAPAGAVGGGAAPRIFLHVWAAGALALLAVFVGCHVAAGKRFASAFLLKNNPVVDKWLAGRRRPPRVLVSDRASTPLSYGFFRPCIILPSGFDFGNAAQAESVLEHEFIHGRERHNIMKALVHLALVLHWFNPLVWLYWLLFCHDLELACDEQVIAAIGPGRRREYAHSLVAVAERAASPFPLASAFAARNLKERIVDVMGYKRTTAFLLSLEILLAACLFAVFGTNAAAGGAGAAPAAGAAAPATPHELAHWSYPEGMSPFAAALSLAGGGVAVKQEIDDDGGRSKHEFTIVSGDREYAVTIDPVTRSATGFEWKSAKKSFAGVESSRLLPMEQAILAALAAAPDGVMSECKLKSAGAGRFIYVAEIAAGGGECEVTIDAATGQVLGVKTER